MRKRRKEWVRHFFVFQMQAKSQRNLWFVSKIWPKQPGLDQNSRWINHSYDQLMPFTHNFDPSFIFIRNRVARLTKIITLSHIVLLFCHINKAQFTVNVAWHELYDSSLIVLDAYSTHLETTRVNNLPKLVTRSTCKPAVVNKREAFMDFFQKKMV